MRRAGVAGRLWDIGVVESGCCRSWWASAYLHLYCRAAGSAALTQSPRQPQRYIRCGVGSAVGLPGVCLACGADWRGARPTCFCPVVDQSARALWALSPGAFAVGMRAAPRRRRSYVPGRRTDRRRAARSSRCAAVERGSASDTVRRRWGCASPGRAGGARSPGATPAASRSPAGFTRGADRPAADEVPRARRSPTISPLRLAESVEKITRRALSHDERDARPAAVPARAELMRIPFLRPGAPARSPRDASPALPHRRASAAPPRAGSRSRVPDGTGGFLTSRFRPARAGGAITSAERSATAT